MHALKFYPVGNGDTSQIVLANGKRLLFDYRHQAQSEDNLGPHVNLKSHLLGELDGAGRDSLDVVAFTHGDQDHISHSTDFFFLEHSKVHQSEGRVHIKELWVPAAMVVETSTQDAQDSEFVLWRQEARHRLKSGAGVRVFSKPEAVKAWMDGAGIDFQSRRALFTDAGQVVPGFTLADDGVEFFVHSPFIKHVDYGDDLRNAAALILHAQFDVCGTRVGYLIVGDTTSDVMDEIVDTTRFHKNEVRLHWDIFNIPHHCSYMGLAPTKGDRETVPTENVKWLLAQGKREAYLVCSSNPIDATEDAYLQDQPPHIQAKNAYVRALTEINGRRFLVTMESPNKKRPEPLVFEISEVGVRWRTTSGTGSLATGGVPRAGTT